MNGPMYAIDGIQIAALPDGHYLFTLVKPGQGVMSNGVCYVRESEWPAVRAYIETIACINKAKSSAGVIR